MTSVLQPESTQVISGLGTYAITVPRAGNYTLGCSCTIPLNSGLQIQLSQSGGTSVTKTIGGSSANPTPTQQILGTSYQFECAASDVLTVALTSSAAADQLANAIQGTITVFRTGA
jgi:hypothetical protein